MAELKWTAEAAGSLRDVYKHIARDRPATALRTVSSIIDRTESLADHPTLGQRYAYSGDRPVRVLTYGQFQIAYLEDGDAIVILGVFHGLIFLPLQ